MLRKLNAAALNAWVDGLIRSRQVVAPQADGERFSFAPLRKASDLRLDYDVAKIAPKKYFQPQSEKFLRYDMAGKFESVVEGEPLVVFGVHPYDFVAIRQMDRIFTEGQCDVHYVTRREKATVVVSDVQTASPNVFAGSVGTAVVREGFDVLLTQVGGDTIVESGSEKGEELIASLDAAPAPDKASLARREQVWEDNRRYLRKHELKMKPGEIPALLAKSFDHPVWEEKAKLCFSCGSCTQVCPTCYCFDVRDDVSWDLKGGSRARVWDGCQLLNFANVAGGHNFRKGVTDRYRHRYYRKGAYVPAKIDGEIACIGCGRCITACVAKIAQPVEVFNRLLENK
jgi:sulfhydrogenase subunit beta (sulfur reductase)